MRNHIHHPISGLACRSHFCTHRNLSELVKKNQYKIEIHFSKKTPKLPILVNVHIKSALQELYPERKKWLNCLQYHYQGLIKQFPYKQADQRVYNVPIGFGDGAGCPGTGLGVGRLTFPVKGMG